MHIKYIKYVPKDLHEVQSWTQDLIRIYQSWHSLPPLSRPQCTHRQYSVWKLKCVLSWESVDPVNTLEIAQDPGVVPETWSSEFDVFIPESHHRDEISAYRKCSAQAIISHRIIQLIWQVACSPVRHLLKPTKTPWLCLDFSCNPHNSLAAALTRWPHRPAKHILLMARHAVLFHNCELCPKVFDRH